MAQSQACNPMIVSCRKCRMCWRFVDQCTHCGRELDGICTPHGHAFCCIEHMEEFGCDTLCYELNEKEW